MSDRFIVDPKLYDPLLALSALDTNFYASFGKHVVPDMFADDVVKSMLQLSRSYMEDADVRKGDSSSNYLYLRQAIQRKVNQGAVRTDVAEAMYVLLDYWFTVLFAESCTPDAVISALAPDVQYYHRDRAVIDIIDAQGRRENLLREAERLKDIARIGQGIADIGVDLHGAAAEVAGLRGLIRRPTGITDLDLAIGGGTPQKSITLWVGSSGVGKSMVLSQVSAYSVLTGANVLYVTLEIPPAYVFARTQAAMTGCSIDDFIAGDKIALSMYDRALSSAGSFRVVARPPKKTTVSDLEELVDRVQDADGRKVDVLAIDYLGKMGTGQKGSKELSMSSYSAGELVITGVEDRLSKGRDLYVHTAHQASRGTREVLGLEDIADSKHYVNSADLVLTINVDKKKVLAHEPSTHIFVAKNRAGSSLALVGPAYPDRPKGIVFPSRFLTEFHNNLRRELAPSVSSGRGMDEWDDYAV